MPGITGFLVAQPFRAAEESADFGRIFRCSLSLHRVTMAPPAGLKPRGYEEIRNFPAL
ncbi:hypothetical protein SAMN02745206_01643 [Desulfacinum infernum DSM 9756]|uniref:Uncharacterized protein n=1 Tax=Desulfacinum infernum DSM 9756 TaxID=1121391 RepID=A0A1M5A5L3_9BACT|nr:hypothetical protein SAMN02745206_01643 [Desulfacinum infernum DSM 9756]